MTEFDREEKRRIVPPFFFFFFFSIWHLHSPLPLAAETNFTTFFSVSLLEGAKRGNTNLEPVLSCMTPTYVLHEFQMQTSRASPPLFAGQAINHFPRVPLKVTGFHVWNRGHYLVCMSSLPASIWAECAERAPQREVSPFLVTEASVMCTYWHLMNVEL